MDVSPTFGVPDPEPMHSRASSGDDDNLSPLRTGPPSEASSQEWDKLGESATAADAVE